MVKIFTGTIDDILSKKQCEDTVDIIDGLRKYWINDSRYSVDNGDIGLPPLWSLGAVSYRDVRENGSEYRRIKSGENRILLTNFKYIYDSLLEKLEPHIGSVELEKTLALPGFHIFGERTHVDNQVRVIFSPDQVFSMVHKDMLNSMHYSHLSKIYKNVDKKENISITLSIALPFRGSGICIWDDSITKENPKEEFSKDIINNKIYENFEFGQPKIIEYKQGSAFCFSGNIYHQIAPALIVNPGDRRITMQAHGMFCDGAWRLFL